MFRKLIYPICFVLVLSLILTSTTSAELVGWWKLDETSSNVAVDSTGNGYDGTVISDDPQWVEGYIDGALQLDGVDDYVQLDIGTLVPTLEEVTFTIWCNWAGGDDWQRIIDIGTDTGNYIYVTTSAGSFNDSLHVAVTNGAWDEFSASTGQYPIGEWHNVAVTVSDSAAKMVMYLDGENVGELEDIVSTISGLGETTNNWLGRSQYFTDDPTLNGTIDDFRIYNHVLSDIDLHTVTSPNYKQSWKPSPSDGEIDVLLERSLEWIPGIISDETYELYNVHYVYFGTDFNSVNDSTEPMDILTDVNEYSAPLDYNTTYYWRVDEASSLDPNTVEKGEVWNLTTANFFVVEDFEDYNDTPGYEVFLTWVDGWGIPTNGATSGYPAPDFIGGEHYLEGNIVHGGLFSLPLFYDNSVGLSEATRDFDSSMRDWTKDDVITLTLFYYGDAGNALVPMYVALNGNAVVTNDAPKAVRDNEWNRWDISLQEFADQGVNLSNVNSMSIGFGDKANPTPGGEGHVFFDDIRLYRSPPVVQEPEPEPVDPGTANLVAYYDFENDVQDNSGHSRHGTAMNGPTYVSGPAGYGRAMKFDGANDYVQLPIGPAIAAMDDITVACWADFSNLGGSWQRLWDFGVTPEAGTDPNIYMFVTPRYAGNGQPRFAIMTQTVAETNVTAPENLPSGWHHIAASIDSSTMTMKLYQDGKLVAEGPTEILPSDLGATDRNYIGKSQWTADAYYRGSIDEFRIYNRALSIAELCFLAGK
jgi:hypothetical protein